MKEKHIDNLEGFTTISHYEHEDGDVSLHASLHRVAEIHLSKPKLLQGTPYFDSEIILIGNHPDGRKRRIIINLFSKNWKSLLIKKERGEGDQNRTD